MKCVIKTPVDATNEVRDHTALESGYTVNYHYRERGIETFIVMKGYVEIIMNGKKFVLEEGDIFNAEAWQPYSMTFLTKDTAIRETRTNRNNKTYDLPDPVDCVDTDKESINEVAARGKGVYEFSTEGIKLTLKVGRWQVGGLKEIWECRVDKGYCLAFNERSENESLYMVRSGRFKVDVDGGKFIAGAEGNGLIYIPPNAAYSLTALSDDCIIQDFNVTCHLFRLLEMVEAALDYFPERLKEQEYVDYLFKANKVVNFKGFSKEQEESE